MKAVVMYETMRLINLKLLCEKDKKFYVPWSCTYTRTAGTVTVTVSLPEAAHAVLAD